MIEGLLDFLPLIDGLLLDFSPLSSLLFFKELFGLMRLNFKFSRFEERFTFLPITGYGAFPKFMSGYLIGDGLLFYFNDNLEGDLLEELLTVDYLI